MDTRKLQKTAGIVRMLIPAVVVDKGLKQVDKYDTCIYNQCYITIVTKMEIRKCRQNPRSISR